MNRIITDINDSNITVAKPGGLLVQSPGYAVLLDDGIKLGQEAREISFLYPQKANNRFWSNLNQARLKTTSGLARHHADLAFAHLIHIHEKAGKPAEMILTVPGSYDTEQLSLLAGLVDASPFTSPLMVDSAVAAVAGDPHAGSCIHIDISLHQTIITTIDTTDRVKRTGTRVIDDTGLLTVYDKCANFIADIFVQQSRFDPLHHAETEQVLYNQLPRCLLSLTSQPEVLLEINYEHNKYQAKLKRDKLVATLLPLYDRIVTEAGSAEFCLVGDRLSQLPGLVEQFNTARVLDAQAVFRGCSLIPLSGGAGDSSVDFITEIKIDPSNAPTQHVVSETEKPVVNNQPVTHLLVNNMAYPVTSAPQYLNAGEPLLSPGKGSINCSFRTEDNSVLMECTEDAGIQVNDKRVQGTHVLTPGDVISARSHATVILAISVVSKNGQKQT